jgi:hypothetical protein
MENIFEKLAAQFIFWALRESSNTFLFTYMIHIFVQFMTVGH